MDNLTPITREEMLMNDEPMTPITREEKILAGEDLNPVTRREYFLKKYRHAGGDVMVEGLEVTANGTYTAPEGKAYSPVEVAVPLPDNAYLLKTASGSLVSFSDGADLPMPSFICNIDAVQDLHGYDSPWVGGAGKNITPPLDQVKSDSGLTVTPQSDGSVIINGTYTGETGWYVITKTFTVYANKTYSVSIGDIASGLINAYGLNGYGQAHTITPTADFNTNVRLNINNGTVFNNVRLYPQTELGEQATPYAPYSNICPISGHTGVDAWVKGKNLAHLANAMRSGQGIDAVVSNEIISARGTANTTYANLNYFNPLNVEKGKTYTVMLSKAVSHNIVFRFATDTSDTVYKQVTVNAGDTKASFVADNNYFHFRLYIGTLTAGTEVNISDLQILVGYGNVESFESYNPNSQTIQVSWQTEAGEIFGGYVDLVSGVLTVTHKYKLFDGTEAWTITSSSSGSNYIAIDDMKVGTRMDGICNFFDTFITGTTAENAGKCQFGNDNQRLYILNAKGVYDADTQAKMRALTTGMQIVYPLAEAQTYQLDGNQIKSLLGNNNAWCDTGNVDIDYFAKEVTG